MSIKQYGKTANVQLSANLKSNEFACKGVGCCNNVIIDEQLVAYVQKIREHFNAPVTINSGYRCTRHNKAVGGAANSYHTKGMAADIVVKGVTPLEVAKYSESIGVLGIGLYETAKDGYFTHIDTRTKKSFWYGQGQAKRDTFGGVTTAFSVIEWQKAAIKDGFNFSKYGADGKWGSESKSVAKKAICKKYAVYKNKNLTALIQKAVGVTPDGKFGNGTETAVKEWQKANGLTADGVVGLNTWKKLLGF